MIGWIYLAGYLFFVRYFIGAALSVVTDGQPDDPHAFEVGLGIALGAITCPAWPVIVPVRVVYAFFKKRLGENAIGKMFPALKPIETRQERIERELEEHNKSKVERERYIAKLEREAGIRNY